MPTPIRCSLIILFLTLLSSVSVSAQDGIYADFATSKGNFTCQLFFEKAPRAVANFITLATGEKAWLNERTGEVSRKPFYDGIIFHRVIDGFMIQGGSPAGDGRDGPGYVFRDEFDPTLRHSKAGVLSMANSGPNTNGSQFFVTLAATSWLDDVHTIFGEVTSGMDVVYAIGKVATTPTPENKPLTPIVIKSVTIRRVGAAANAFNPATQNLPLVGGGGVSLVRQASNLYLQIPWAARSEYWLYFSPDLTNWLKQRLGFFANLVPSGSADVTDLTKGQARYFFRVSQVVYPGVIYAPQSVLGSQLTLNPSAPGEDTFILNFNNSGGGTFNRTSNSATTSGAITVNSWDPKPYQGQLDCFLNTFGRIVVITSFTSPAGGKYTIYRPIQLDQWAAYQSGSFTFMPTVAAAPAMLTAASATSTSTSPTRTTTTTTRNAVRAKRRK